MRATRDCRKTMIRIQKIEKRKIKARSKMKQYPARGNNDVAQRSHGVVQGLEHGRDPYVEALPLHALGGGIKGEERRCQILRIRPPV